MKFKKIKICGSIEGKEIKLEDFGIDQKVVEELNELIQRFEELDLIKSNKVIEVICIKRNQLWHELNKNDKILIDPKKFQREIFEYKEGLRVPRKMLRKNYKEDLICYCVFGNKNSILTIFHELAHCYNQPFEDKAGEIITDVKQNLRERVRRLINEYYANYNMTKFLLDADSWHSELSQKALDEFTELKRFKVHSKNDLSNESFTDIMKYYFKYIFNRIFYFMGIWRGFYEKEIKSTTLPFSLHWDLTLSSKEIDTTSLTLLDFLKQDLLTLNFSEKAENICENFEKKFREYFNSFNLEE